MGGPEKTPTEDSCAVCCGEGNYPIINRYGRTIYYITCPECLGDGKPCEDSAPTDREG